MKEQSAVCEDDAARKKCTGAPSTPALRRPAHGLRLQAPAARSRDAVHAFGCGHDSPQSCLGPSSPQTASVRAVGNPGEHFAPGGHRPADEGLEKQRGARREEREERRSRGAGPGAGFLETEAAPMSRTRNPSRPRPPQEWPRGCPTRAQRRQGQGQSDAWILWLTPRPRLPSWQHPRAP